jgi:ribosomal protein S18 acetylase RimI-like enzyme
MTFFEKLALLNINNLKFDILAKSKIYFIIKQLKYNFTKRDIIMTMKTTCFDKQDSKGRVIFKHFKEGHDEELRCTIQNSVFYDKNRIPLIAEDISSEENEDYYINNFGVFICEGNGQAIGYGQIILSEGLYTIVNLGIIDDYRQQGYGELLVKYLIEFCYKKSIKDIYIRVEKKNTKALSLYNKIGFNEYELIANEYKDIDSL